MLNIRIAFSYDVTYFSFSKILVYVAYFIIISTHYIVALVNVYLIMSLKPFELAMVQAIVSIIFNDVHGSRYNS